MTKNYKTYDYNFLLEEVIPELNRYYISGETGRYNDLIECSKIDSIVYSLRFHDEDKKNLTRHTAKFQYEKIHLKYCSMHDIDEWKEIFFKKLNRNLFMMKISSTIPDNLSNRSKEDKEYAYRALREEILSENIDNIKFVSKNCTLFTSEQLNKYEDLLIELGKVKPSIFAYSCK